MNIPADTDVLVTDLSEEIHYGDSVLRQRVMQVHPKLHLFGHIHNAAGIEERDGTMFPNVAGYCFKKCVWTEVHQLLRLCKYINISVKAG